MKYFRNAFLFIALSIGVAAYLGGINAIFAVFVLGLLEVSLSFDNAIVNAVVLKNMQPTWQKRFINWGMAISVVGMRFIFPALIIMLAGHMGAIEAVQTALFKPIKYALIMTFAHVDIMSFGGTFLMLVSLHYFLDTEKEVHWLSKYEAWLAKMGNIKSIQISLALLMLLIMSNIISNPADILALWRSGIAGILTYMAVDLVGEVLENRDTTINVAKAGLGGFLYLEVLDASFSFDGVISSFIITNDIILIALGLGVGAYFMRSLTLLFVDKGILHEYKYLEAGAFYSITALWVLSFLSICIEVPLLVTGLTSVTIITLAFRSSVNYNRLYKTL